MKLECNYYRETEELFDEKKIDIDYFKYPRLGVQMGIMNDLKAFENFCNKLTAKRPILCMDYSMIYYRKLYKKSSILK